MTIEQGNKLIAEFMGAEYFEHPMKHLGNDNEFIFKTAPCSYHSNKQWAEDRLHYHQYWDWLMPVVEKIEKDGYGFSVDPWGIEIIDYKTGNEEIRVKFENDDNYQKIEQYYKSVVQFIQWYNQQPPSPDNKH